MSRRLAVYLAILTLLTALGGAGACSRDGARHDRVLVIGIDGATHRMVDPMIAAGELPILAGIRERGIAGSLRAQGPLLSPRIWTSLVTGVPPERHGIENWVWLDVDERPHLYASSDRRVPALWNIASDAGREVAVVNWLMTHPPEPIAGVVVSDHVLPAFSRGELRIAGQFAKQGGRGAAVGIAQEGEEVPAVYPEAWRERIDALRAAGPELSSVKNPFDRGDDIENENLRALSHFLWETFENDGAIARMAQAVEQQTRPDLMLVYLPGVDRVSHLLWPRDLYFEGAGAAASPSVDAADRDRVHFGWLRDYYRYVDDLIGALTRDYGPDDLVVVLSDHGFERAPEGSWPPGKHESPAARDGIFYASGPAVRKGESPTVSMLDLTPALLGWLGLAVAEDMPGDPSAFLTADAHKTIPTYGTQPQPAGHRRAPDDDARIDALRLLGYVD